MLISQDMVNALALDFGGNAKKSGRQTMTMHTDYIPPVFWHWSLIGNCECWTIECQIRQRMGPNGFHRSFFDLLEKLRGERLDERSCRAETFSGLSLCD